MEGSVDEAPAWVGDGWGSGVGDEGDGAACTKPRENRGELLALVVFVEARGGRCDAVVLEKLGRASRVLGGDQVDLTQDTECAEG